MTDNNLTFVKGIIDRSGSMARIADDTAGAWNHFVREQAGQQGVCMVSLTQFDHEINTVYAYQPAGEVPEYQLHPRGRTALLDAIGGSIAELGIKLSEMPEEKRPGSVVIVILTDGQENASREYIRARISEMIKEQQDRWKWQFIFLGADMQAVAEARSWGMTANTSAVYDSHNVAEAIGMTSSNVSSYRSARAGGRSADEAAVNLGYSDSQRAAFTAVKPKDQHPDEDAGKA